jgi:hypothetical protein
MGERLRSGKPKTLRGAVAELKRKKKYGVLVFAATYGEDAAMRGAAIRALSGKWEMLAEVAKRSTTDSAGIAAVNQIRKDSCTKRWKMGERFWRVMVDIANRAGRENVAFSVLGNGIEGPRLVNIACNSAHPRVRMAALKGIDDAHTRMKSNYIAEIMRDSVFADSRNGAIEAALKLKMLEPGALVSDKERVDAAVRRGRASETFTSFGGLEFNLGQGRRIIGYLAAKSEAQAEQTSQDRVLFDQGVKIRMRSG